MTGRTYITVIMAATAALLTACSFDVTVEQTPDAVIGFEKAFVNNSTKAGDEGLRDPSITNGSDFDYAVYGYKVMPSGLPEALSENYWIYYQDEDSGSVSDIMNYVEPVFDNYPQQVHSGGSYSPKKKWESDYAYFFSAVAPYEGRNWEINPYLTFSLLQIEIEDYLEMYSKGLLLLYFKNNGIQDFMMAPPMTVDLTKEDSRDVKFDFAHALAKVKFTFKNDFTYSEYSDYTIKVSDIHIENAPEYSVMLTISGSPLNYWIPVTTESSTDFIKYLKENFPDVSVEEAFHFREDEDFIIDLDFGDAVLTNAVEDAANHITSGKTAESYYEKLLIPVSDQEYTISFTVTVHDAAGEVCKTERHSMTTEKLSLSAGCSYNIIANFEASHFFGDEMKKIGFDVVEGDDWTYGDAEDKDAYQTSN